MRRLVVAAAAGVLMLGALADPASAQQAPAYGLEAASVHLHGTAVAVALRFHAGSQDDGVGSEGTAWLLARVLEEEVGRALGTAPAVFAASVERSTTVFTLVAEPPAWEAAWRTADSVVFQAVLDPAVVERQRAALAGSLSFEADSPYGEFEGRAAALLADPGSPWARALRGTPASVRALGTSELQSYRAGHLRREAAAWAVVGPIPSDAHMPAPPPPPARASNVAWLTGDRVVLAQDVTSTWIAVAYPVPSDLPRTHLELLAHLVREDLDPVPPTPDRYDVEVRVEETPGGPVLLVEASVVPEAAPGWERRILGALDRLATDAPAEDFFRWRRRRFRAERLLAESAPEAEAARITADLLRDGRPRDLDVEIWGLDSSALREAARTLGPPRILVLGPDLGSASR